MTFMQRLRDLSPIIRWLSPTPTAETAPQAPTVGGWECLQCGYYEAVPSKKNFWVHVGGSLFIHRKYKHDSRQISYAVHVPLGWERPGFVLPKFTDPS